MSGLNNPNSAYSLTLLSHQTGLSATISTALVPVNIGSAITVTKNGLIRISLKGHVNAGIGLIDYTLTRASVVYYFWEKQPTFHTSTTLGASNAPYDSLFADGSVNDSIGLVVASNLEDTFDYGLTSGASSKPSSLPVLVNDVIQFRASQLTAGDIVYIDDLVVMLQ